MKARQNLLTTKTALLALALTAVPGCRLAFTPWPWTQESYENVRASVDAGFAGKTWTDTAFLERSPYLPELHTLSLTAPTATYTRTVNSFDLTVSGTSAYLAYTGYSTAASRFLGYGRTYRQGSGWSNPGTGFAPVARGATAADSLGQVAVGIATRGAVAAYFPMTLSASADVFLAGQSGGAWQAWGSTDLTGGAFAGFDLTQSGAFFPAAGVKSLLSTGHTALGFVVDDPAANAQEGNVHLALGEPNRTVKATADSTHELAQDSGGEAQDGFKMLEDGLGNLCEFHASWVAGATHLLSRCYTSVGSTYAAPIFTPAWVAPMPANSGNDMATDIAGFDAATDGEGRILVVAFVFNTLTSLYDVQAQWIDAGVAGLSMTQLNVNLPLVTLRTQADLLNSTSISVLEAPAYASPAPSVAYLGDGSYMVAWIGHDELSCDSSGTEFCEVPLYTVYDPTTGTWSSPAAINGTTTLSGTVRPHMIDVRLAGNDSSHALAMITQVTTEGTDIYSDIRQVTALRYHTLYGWGDSATLGYGCTLEESRVMAFCSQRPKGAILSNGDAIAVFMDQDYTGAFRLAGSQYK